MTFEEGHILAGRYRLEERIATGGMGEVWHAYDETLSRAVAVKVLRPDTADDAAFAERFRAEARHSGGLSHPNIGTVHDFGEDEGTAYLVMELLEGKPLSTIISERAPLDPQLASGILYQAAIALQAAHEAGVVHRDVKPANIVVDDDGYAKLTDFGISRALSEAPLTQTGEVLGTPHYLSPEQAQGQPAGPLSDVYALAVVGYEMITGQRPFAGDSMVTTALAHVSQPAPPLPESVPEPLRTTVMAGLAKDPAQRPASAAEFAEALRLPPGETPRHLEAGAASAVAPVLVGGTIAFDPSATPASVVAGMPVPGQQGVHTPPHVFTAAVPRTRRRWLLPLAAAAVGLVLIVVIALTAGRSSGKDAIPGSGQPTTVATLSAPAAGAPRATVAATDTAAVTPATPASASLSPAAPGKVQQPGVDATETKSKSTGKGKRVEKK